MILSLSSLLHMVAAIACLIWSGVILLAGPGRTAWPLAGACIAASLWLAVVALATSAPLDGWAGGLELLRSLAWLAVLLVLSRRLGSGTPPRAWGFILVGGVAAAAALGLALPGGLPGGLPGVAGLPTLGSPSLLAHLGLSLLVVVVAENLYRNAPEEGRWHLILPCVTLGGLAAFDVLLHADAVLGRAYSPALLDARAVLTALAMPLLIVAALRDRRWRRPLMSRQLVFHGATLVFAGTFLIGVGAAGEVLRHWGADWSQAAQASLLAAAVMLLVLLLASRSMRSRLRGLVVDHFFAARYDYRREWLRCVATLSGQGASPETRAITAIADAVDSPAGKLLLRVPGERGLHWTGSWNMDEDGPSIGDSHPLIAQLRGGSHVVEPVPLPGGFWLAVPLLHHSQGLIGIVLLAPPRAAFALDAEVFDLLRSVGRAVAMFMAERQAATLLADQRDVQTYAQRFAFVAHDVKTVASQLTMMLANAERHIADPAFQADMLLTVAASAARINTLIARLRQPEEASAPTISPPERIARLARGHAHPITLDSEAGTLDGEAGALVAMAPDRFDAAILHLLDNAARASPPNCPVRIRLSAAAGSLAIDIIDRGEGMSPRFIRESLFRPLRSGHADGNGIGAWQARDLLRGAGGDLTVISAPQHGTTMRIALPLLAATAAIPPIPALSDQEHAA